MVIYVCCALVVVSVCYVLFCLLILDFVLYVLWLMLGFLGGLVFFRFCVVFCYGSGF